MYGCLRESEVRTRELAPQVGFELATRRLTAERAPPQCNCNASFSLKNTGFRFLTSALGCGMRGPKSRPYHRSETQAEHCHIGPCSSRRSHSDAHCQTILQR